MIIEARCHLRYRRVISAIRCFYCDSGEYRLVLMASLSLCPNHLLHAALVMGDAPLGFPVRGPACLVLDTRFSDLATIEGGRTLHFAGKCPRRTHRGSDTQRACPLSEHPSRQQLNAESERSPHGDARTGHAAPSEAHLLRSCAGSALIARFDNQVAGRTLVAPARPEHRRSVPSMPWKP